MTVGATLPRSMRGGKSRRRAPRALGLPASVAVLAVALLCGVLCGVALAQTPATEEYNLDIPEATSSGSGGGDPVGGSSEGSGDTSTAEPAPAPIEPEAPVGGGGDGAGGGSGSSGGGDGGSGDANRKHTLPADDQRALISYDEFGGEQANSLPAIAADVASEGGVALLLAGLAATMGIALFFVYRRRRAQELEVS
jgi:hypothetical protein